MKVTMRLLRKGKEMKREIDKKGEGRFKKAVKKIESPCRNWMFRFKKRDGVIWEGRRCETKFGRERTRIRKKMTTKLH